MTDRETLGVYAARAQEYADRIVKSETSKHLQDFMKEVAAGGRVLDLGCGPGHAAARLAAEGYKVDAWDASPEMAEVGRKNYGVEIEVKGFAALSAKGTYDGVYANFSLLHSPKAEMPTHLASIARALKPGGILHIGLKTGVGEMRDSIGRFYAYYEEAELTGLLVETGMTVTSRAFGKGVGLAGTDEPWMILRARKDD